MRISSTAAFAAILLSTVSVSAFAAEEAKDPYADSLLGNWGGVRTKLANAGIDTTVEYKADLWRVAEGGMKRSGSYLDNLDVKFELDGEKLFGLKGNKSLIYFINNNGGRPNAREVGSVQGIDNIETVKSTAKLYEAWTEQSMFNDKVAVLVGLHDLNSEFMASDGTTNFIKPVMQVGQTLAQTGQNGPSIFPTTSVAARVKFIPTEATYVSAAIFDGVPGHVNHPYATRVDFQKNDGALLIAEAGWTPKVTGSDDATHKLAFGAWTYTKKFDDVVDVDAAGDPVKHRSQGFYALSNCQFYTDKASGRTLNVFLRGGVADGDTARMKWDYEVGFVGNGWVPKRPDGEIGIGLAQAHTGSKYIRSDATADRNEYSTELYYRDKVYSGISLQPDLQYIVNPSSDRNLKNATVVGMRVDINF